MLRPLKKALLIEHPIILTHINNMIDPLTRLIKQAVRGELRRVLDLYLTITCSLMLDHAVLRIRIRLQRSVHRGGLVHGLDMVKTVVQ